MGEERLSRIPENRMFALERVAEAEKDRAGAELDRVKALKELDDLDISQLEKLVAMSNALKALDDKSAESRIISQQLSQPQQGSLL